MKTPHKRWPVLLAISVILLVVWAAMHSGRRGADDASARVAHETAAPSQAPSPTPTVQTCVRAIAAQSDPAKLATLTAVRAANSRLKRIVYYLAIARSSGADPGHVIDMAQAVNQSAGTPRAPLVKDSLLRNLKIGDGLGILDAEDLARMRRGESPIVRRGPYAGQVAEVDHIVPLAIAPEMGNELANLEILPETLNRAKAAKVGERQLALAKTFRAAGLISDATMANVQAAFVPSARDGKP